MELCALTLSVRFEWNTVLIVAGICLRLGAKDWRLETQLGSLIGFVFQISTSDQLHSEGTSLGEETVHVTD